MQAAAASAVLLALLVTGCDPGGPPAARPGWPEGSERPERRGSAEPSWSDTARPIIIGHRGSGRDGDEERYPENTIPSILNVIESEGAVGVEFDVMLTRDLEVVVMHDTTLDRTTDCAGCVSERTLEELRACRSTGGRTSSGPPTIAEVLRAIEDLPVEPFVTVDSKPALEGCPAPGGSEADHAALLGRRIGEEIAAVGTQRFTSIQGPVELLRAARKAAPGVMTLLAHSSMSSAVTIAEQEGFTGVAVGLIRLEEESVQRARAAGLLIDTFVVNAPVDLAVALGYGVDSIETDDVDVLMEAFR